jgi:hypothetical protein
MMIALGGRYVNLDHVRSIEFATRSDVDYADVTFADGSTGSLKTSYEISETTISSMMVPAPAGFRLAIVVGTARGPETTILEEPILAFRIPHSGCTPTPVTIQGEAGKHSPKDQYWGVIRPDGSVLDQGGSPYKDVAEFSDFWKNPD